jgi:hypothetical protein
MIEYTEKGPGLHARIAEAGHWLRQENGAWIASDEVAVQAIIDGYTLADCRAEIHAAIDARAAERREAGVRGVTPAEMAFWAVKRAEALAYQANPGPAQAPLLAAEAVARNIGLAALVARVLAAYRALADREAAIAGVAGRHKDAVTAAQSFEAALAYDWSTGWL